MPSIPEAECHTHARTRTRTRAQADPRTHTYTRPPPLPSLPPSLPWRVSLVPHRSLRLVRPERLASLLESAVPPPSPSELLLREWGRVMGEVGGAGVREVDSGCCACVCVHVCLRTAHERFVCVCI